MSSGKGTLVVAPPRDTAELKRFAARTSEFGWLDGEEIETLEPDLAGRFRTALFFKQEAHLDPRRAITALSGKLAAMGVIFHFSTAPDFPGDGFDHIMDCTGASAIGTSAGLRGVRGEMLVLETPDVTLSRPIRLLHPRIPLYIVPRGDGRFMVGATMIESNDCGPVSARSLMELLNAAYALHPRLRRGACHRDRRRGPSELSRQPAEVFDGGRHDNGQRIVPAWLSACAIACAGGCGAHSLHLENQRHPAGQAVRSGRDHPSQIRKSHGSKPMKLTINGEDHQTDISDLSQLLTSLDYEGDWLATAVNGELVHRDERTGFVLSDRDRVEILSPMQGG